MSNPRYESAIRFDTVLRRYLPYRFLLHYSSPSDHVAIDVGDERHLKENHSVKVLMLAQDCESLSLRWQTKP